MNVHGLGGSLRLCSCIARPTRRLMFVYSPLLKHIFHYAFHFRLSLRVAEQYVGYEDFKTLANIKVCLVT